jgi:hypothetical protein
MIGRPRTTSEVQIPRSGLTVSEAIWKTLKPIPVDNTIRIDVPMNRPIVRGGLKFIIREWRRERRVNASNWLRKMGA